jgi:hypothetical protein
MTLKTKDYIVTMRCTECEHEYLLEPAVVVPHEDGTVSRYFGSAYDFCEKCDGYPKEIQCPPHPV